LAFLSPWFLVLIGPGLLLYHFISQKKQNFLLLAASYAFYGALDPRFLCLILLSTTADYLVARGIHLAGSVSKKRVYLGISLAVNLGVLFLFKYLGFFVSTIAGLARALGLSLPEPALHIIVPAALSFYTFKTLTYTIDVYRGHLAPTRSFLDYALFVSFFPQLLAGPIERAAHFLPQLHAPRSLTKDRLIQGFWLILLGFFKKAVVADNLALVVNEVFDGSAAVAGFHVLLATYAFSFQIYCDFSGYSDIARGIGKLLGFETPLNFNRPYLSLNPVDFWQRWHITLSTWLRDYLFLPIAYAVMRRMEKPFLRLKVEDWGYMTGIILTMLLAGLWHGAAWTFVVWGGYHGLLIALHHLLARRKKRRRRSSKIAMLAKAFAFFHLTALGWLIFRAQSLNQAWDFLRRIFVDFPVAAADIQMLFMPIFYLFILLGLEALGCSRDDPRSIPGWRFGLGPALVTVLILLLIFFYAPAGQDFIYARF
jgi:D-alanyl-lipoteichoic acid acyltransferase DltB (MBOAT superfamily)